jgi:hypothetical protein
MHRYRHLIVICCFFTFFNCKEEQQTVFSDISISTKNNTIVEVNIPKATGNKDISDRINTVIQNTIISALHIGNPNTIKKPTIEASITAFNNEFNVFKTAFPKTSQIWEAQIDGEVVYQSQELICIAITAYTNTGGAHGNVTISFLNFDSETGQTLSNDRLFNDIENFKRLAESYFKAETKDKILFDNKAFELPENMGFNPDGMVLLYNTYEIAPYATGIIEFVIPFNKVETYLVFNSL